MAKVMISAEELDDGILWLDGNPVHSEVVDERRWYRVKLVTFKHDGKLLQCEYLEPASELQDDQERFRSDPVECTEVEAYEKTVTAYRAAE